MEDDNITIITKIEAGGFPNTVGHSFTKDEIQKIQSILQAKKDWIDKYFKTTIANRLSA